MILCGLIDNSISFWAQLWWLYQFR